MASSSVLLSAHLRVPMVIPSQFRCHPPVSSSIKLNTFATLALSTAEAPSQHHHGSLHAAALESSISAEADSSSEAATMCLESDKSYSYKQCDSDMILELVDFHNMDANDMVRDLNQETTKNNTFVILDLFQAFLDVLQGKDYQSRFPEALKGCCMGTTSEGYCAVVDEHWKPMYTVCSDPQRSFFWDMVHPTQAG